MAPRDLVIVGAGASGLAAAHAARRLGVEPLVLDAADGPGGAYRIMPRRMGLISPRWENALGAEPLPDGPAQVYRGEYLEYLARYAAAAAVEVRYGVAVERVERSGSGFVVRLGAGEAVEARRVVMATGLYTNPIRPAPPGLAGSPIESLHACDYQEPGPFAGRRVLVVGRGNSAGEIAMELRGAGAEVELSTRRPMQFAPAWSPVPPGPVAGAAQRLVRRIPVWALPFVGERLATPVFTPGLQAALASGDVRGRAEVLRVEAGEAIHADGARSRPEAIIWATGYRPALTKPLEGLVSFESSGLPRQRGGLSVEVPGLGFLGLPRLVTFVSEFLRGIRHDAPQVVEALLRRR